VIEALEGLDVAAPGGGPDARRSKLAYHSIDVVPGRFPYRPPQLSQEALKGACAVLNGDLAEAAGYLRSDIRVDELALISQGIWSGTLGHNGFPANDPQPPAIPRHTFLPLRL
jgi:hypothetical protein